MRNIIRNPLTLFILFWVYILAICLHWYLTNIPPRGAFFYVPQAFALVWFICRAIFVLSPYKKQDVLILSELARRGVLRPEHRAGNSGSSDFVAGGTQLSRGLSFMTSVYLRPLYDSELVSIYESVLEQKKRKARGREELEARVKEISQG